MQYKVEFLPSDLQVKSGQTQSAVNSVESVLNKYASQGYELVQIAQISVMEKPGCLGGLLGQKATGMNYNMIVFSKK